MSYSSRTSNYRRPNNNRRQSYGSRPGKTKKGDYINPTRFIKQATPAEDNVYTAAHSFEDFGLHPIVKQNLAANGFIEPTPIQDQTIPAVMQGRDIVGIANTGTGKTAAFTAPLLHRLINDRHSRALIIAPTRELAQQIEAECRKIAKSSGIFGAVLIGGSSMSNQLRDLRQGPEIVIGTPGRIKDHTDRGSLKLSTFNIIVLDEVDRMLDMGFVNEISRIFSSIADKRQCLFFSATLDSRVSRLIDGFATEPTTISVDSGQSAKNINQDIVQYGTSGDKLDKLHSALISGSIQKVIVFEETQRSVERLGKELVSRGFQADSIHGGKSQGQRQRALKRFKENEINVLVATNVAARGIDVIDVTHVINYSIPQTFDDYIHRIGRAGRAGRIGHALTFVPADY